MLNKHIIKRNIPKAWLTQNCSSILENNLHKYTQLNMTRNFI